MRDHLSGSRIISPLKIQAKPLSVQRLPAWHVLERHPLVIRIMSAEYLHHLDFFLDLKSSRLRNPEQTTLQSITQWMQRCKHIHRGHKQFVVAKG